MEDYVTWVDTSKLKRTIMRYNDEVCTVQSFFESIRLGRIDPFCFEIAGRLRSSLISRRLSSQLPLYYLLTHPPPHSDILPLIASLLCSPWRAISGTSRCRQLQDTIIELFRHPYVECGSCISRGLRALPSRHGHDAQYTMPSINPSDEPIPRFEKYLYEITFNINFFFFFR